jgi:hypothetical protein
LIVLAIRTGSFVTGDIVAIMSLKLNRSSLATMHIQRCTMPADHHCDLRKMAMEAYVYQSWKTSCVQSVRQCCHSYSCMQKYAFLIVDVAAADTYLSDEIFDGMKLITIMVKPVGDR